MTERETMPRTAAEYLDALIRLAEKRPGIDPALYASPRGFDADSRRAYYSDRRTATNGLRLVREISRPVRWRLAEVDPAWFVDSASRIDFYRERGGRLAAEYCVGQFFGTEFRHAVAGLLWKVLTRYHVERLREAGAYGEEGADSVRARMMVEPLRGGLRSRLKADLRPWAFRYMMGR